MIVSVLFAVWLLRCQNTASTSFKLSWGMTWSRLCVSTALWISAGLGADSQPGFSLLVHSLHSCCSTCSWLERQPLLHMCPLDQIPAVLFFCSVTRWSVRLYSPAHSTTCFPSARPSPASRLFDLHFSHLPPSSLPSSCPHFWHRRRWSLLHLLIPFVMSSLVCVLGCRGHFFLFKPFLFLKDETLSLRWRQTHF